MSIRIHLLNPEEILGKAVDHASSCYNEIKTYFEQEPAECCVLVQSPKEADIILAAIQGFSYGIGLEKLKRHSIFKKHKPKLFVYSPDDNQIPTIRGLYPSISRYYVNRNWALPCHYISSHIRKFDFGTNPSVKDMLFTFVGSSRTHVVRDEILALTHPDCFLLDSSKDLEPGSFWWDSGRRDDLFNIFHEFTARSLFVICPRGLSPSSIRLYEAMQAGCAPMIVSDDIQLPVGPNWDAFTIKVQENDVSSIPSIAERLRDKAPEMGALARKTWEEYFSPQATAGFIASACQTLLDRKCVSPMQLLIDESLNPEILKSRLKTRIMDFQRKTLAS